MSTEAHPTAGEAPDDEPKSRGARRFSHGEVIFREGDSASEAYVLTEGRVRLIRRVNGVERSLAILRAGDLFGETALLAGSLRSSTAIALVPSTAMVLDQEALAALLEADAAAAARLVTQLARRLRDAEDQIEILMLKDAQSKVVGALLKLALQEAGDESAGAHFSISPLELSARVGLDVDAVKRGVQQLREGQYVRVVDERLEIPDLDALRRLYALLALKEGIRGEAP
jgi:CRP-like cAMP-binding protein